MRCEDCRDAISARMDGEHAGADAGAVERHLAVCADCRAFADGAARVTRLARIRPVEEHPDVLPGLLAALDEGASRPAQRRTKQTIAREAVRAALAVLGVGQLALALSGIVAASGAGPGRLAGASMTHFSHEAAAWNLALGVAFGWAAIGASRRAGGLVPVIGAFVALLVALSTMDLLAGHVDAARLAGHLPVVAGLVLLVLHARLGRDGGDTTGASADEPSRTDDRNGGRLGGRFGAAGFGDGGIQPTAHHPAA